MMEEVSRIMGLTGKSNGVPRTKLGVSLSTEKDKKRQARNDEVIKYGVVIWAGLVAVKEVQW